MSRIGLIDVDGHHFPNIPLMKVSSWHKAHGDTVEWVDPMFGGHFHKVYMSKVFSFTPDIDWYVDADEVVKGGTGYCIDIVDGREVFHPELDTPLPPEVEHAYPDYSIYPQFTEDTAYGFLSRGCPRGCDFCIVAPKEGRASRKVADLDEFWRGQGKIVLCDPNILACRDWADLLGQLAESKAVVDINQGLDVRILTEEKALRLAEVRMRDVHFAWDRYGDRDRVLAGLELFRDVVIERRRGLTKNAVVYTIVNFDTTMEQDLDRIYTLRDMGYRPYVMIYDREHAPSVYRKMARWVNNRFVFGKCDRFENYR